MTKKLAWNDESHAEGVEILKGDGGAIVCPTKVGYIIMTSDMAGLERKFEAKDRKRNKPGVVLCATMEQLCELAEMNDEIIDFYQDHYDDDILLGCILPWQKSALEKLPQDGCQELMMDTKGTSCFVVKFGTPSERICKELWEEHGKCVFASSANPSGKGNRGKVEFIGEKIENAVDLVITGNDYVDSIQPDATEETRWEQGVMVSFVDEDGKLFPTQKGERMVTPAPILIRRGIYNNEIMHKLSEHFLSWDYRHGHYY